MSELHAMATGASTVHHGALWEMSHHPLHSTSAAFHWMFSEYAHDDHPRRVPPHLEFIELATMSREMDHL